MIQWKTDARTLVIHGGSDDENEDSSYYTVVAVPRLGCLDCKQLRDDHYPDSNDCKLIIYTFYFLLNCFLPKK